nr:MAG TPA: hypothetical protein [Caudoviricetes sp.]
MIKEKALTCVRAFSEGECCYGRRLIPTCI